MAWEQRMSASRGIPYFFNTATGETRWDAPPGETVRVVDAAGRREKEKAGARHGDAAPARESGDSGVDRPADPRAAAEKHTEHSHARRDGDAPPAKASRTDYSCAHDDPAGSDSSKANLPTESKKPDATTTAAAQVRPIANPAQPKPTPQPAKQALPPNSVHAFHLLVKHAGVRRPSSWREERISRSPAQATALAESYRREIESAAEAGGSQAALARLRDLASRFSDCSSAKRGGDLGVFGRGQMQRAFEDAAFALAPGRVSTPVVTDSGVHLIFVVERSD